MNHHDTVLMLVVLILGMLTVRMDAYAIYGSRRFVRPVRSSWRSAPAAPSYYPSYPAYTGDYEDEVIPEETPMYTDAVNYYPPPRYYYGRAVDPVDQMEMRNDEPGADLPIGQETWFESQTAAQAAAAERAAVNDAFMQNLILAEMYRNDPSQYYGYGTDEEERELKSLSQVKRSGKKTSPAAGTAKPFTGQKEVPMLRPPNPARKHGTDAPATGGHPPSVYDTIKQLLSLESKESGAKHEEVRVQPKKRFVSNEESLVRQLSGLKNKVTA